MSSELSVLKDVCRRLEAGRFEYMLTGSMALNYYAQPRMTRDLDIVVALTVDDWGRFGALFEDAYYVPEVTLAGPQSIPMFNLLHLASVVKIDFILRRDDEFRRTEFNRRIRVRLLDFDCWIVSREDLILSKLVWAADSRSDFQLRDVRHLLAEPHDLFYLEHWANMLAVAPLLKELRGE